MRDIIRYQKIKGGEGMSNRPPELLDKKICEKCGKEYQPTSNRQKWCIECGNKIKKEKKKEYMKKYHKENYKKKGYNQKAVKYYKEVLTDDSKNISVYVNLGDLYLKNNEYNNNNFIEYHHNQNNNSS